MLPLSETCPVQLQLRTHTHTNTQTAVEGNCSQKEKKVAAARQTGGSKSRRHRSFVTVWQCTLTNSLALPQSGWSGTSTAISSGSQWLWLATGSSQCRPPPARAAALLLPPLLRPPPPPPPQWSGAVVAEWMEERENDHQARSRTKSSSRSSSSSCSANRSVSQSSACTAAEHHCHYHFPHQLRRRRRRDVLPLLLLWCRQLDGDFAVVRWTASLSTVPLAALTPAPQLHQLQQQPTKVWLSRRQEHFLTGHRTWCTATTTTAATTAAQIWRLVSTQQTCVRPLYRWTPLTTSAAAA